jgi:NADH-quinone oxidoreductase subunit J
MEFIVFCILAAVALVGAILTVSCASAVRSAMSLILCLFAVAGLFVLLKAHFIAAMQVLVYAGAIMVLFVFVVMLLNLSPERFGRARVTVLGVVSGLAVLLVAGKLARTIVMVPPDASPAVPGQPLGPDFGSVSTVGQLLFKQFLLPFELTSVLLLVAVVAAIVIARQRFSREGQQP